MHLEGNNAMHQYTLRVTHLESSLSEKDLRDLEDTKLNMSQQCTLAEKASRVLGCQEECCQEVEGGNPSLCSALLRPLWVSCVCSGLHTTRETWP